MPLTETVALIEMQSSRIGEKPVKLACTVRRQGNERNHGLPICNRERWQILFRTSGRAHGWKSIEEVVLPCPYTRFVVKIAPGYCVLVASGVIRNQICSFDSPFFDPLFRTN